MLTISFKATFVKQMNNLEKALADEVFEKISLFKDIKNHKALKVHKLHGKFSECFSFSVTYSSLTFKTVFIISSSKGRKMELSLKE